MKKLNYRKIMSCMIAIMMVVSVISPAAAQASPRGLLCPYCGSNSILRTIAPGHTNQVTGLCGHGTHYYATKGTQWVCTSCGEPGRGSIEVGHYCTGDGGHYCWDGSCSCTD